MTYEVPGSGTTQEEVRAAVEAVSRRRQAASEEFQRRRQAASEELQRQRTFNEQVQHALQGKDIASRLSASALALDYLLQQVSGQQKELWDQVAPEASRLAQAESRLRSAEESVKAEAPVMATVGPQDGAFTRNLRRILLAVTAVAAVAMGVLLVGHFALTAGWAKAWPYLVAVTGGLLLLLLASRLAMFIGRRWVSGAPVGPDNAGGSEEVGQAKSQVELARLQLADALRTRAIEPMLRSLANELLGPSYSTHLDVRYSPGLSEVFDTRYEVSTEAARDLSSVISMIKGGSIGLAGPRGSGKTTLIESVCEGRTKALTSEMVSLKVSAPVDYEPRDFILYLFSRVCREFTGPVTYTIDSGNSYETGSYDDSQDKRLGYARHRILNGAFGVGVVSIVLGVLQLVFPSAPWINGASFIAIGVAILFVAYAALDWPSGFFLRPWRAGYGSIIRSRIWVAGLVGSSAFIGLGILRILHPNSATSHGVPLIVVGIAIPFATFAGLNLPALLRRIRATPAVEPYVAPYVAPELHISGTSKLSVGPGGSSAAFKALQKSALEHLGVILYQQTYTSGWSGTLKVPIAELAGNIGRSQARQPMTYPEVASALRQFLKDIADSFQPVIIGIDELDKMESGDKARQFLNEIKSIFGVQGCYFLVSVSMDAMSSFERRGMPFRDAFDSSFDDIILVQPLQYEDARNLINRRVIGMANPFIALAHVISGGLARDIIRSTRKQVALAAAMSRDDLESISSGVVAAEVEAKLMATETALQEDCTSKQKRRFVELREQLDPADATSLLDAARSLMPSVPNADGPGTPKAGLLDGLAAYLYFAATVVSFFDGSFSERRLRDAEESGLLDKLANSRRTFTLGPEAAWAKISECRHACGFPQLLPWPDEN